jgi:hypothetical protein
MLHSNATPRAAWRKVGLCLLTVLLALPVGCKSQTNPTPTQPSQPTVGDTQPAEELSVPPAEQLPAPSDKP